MVAQRKVVEGLSRVERSTLQRCEEAISSSFVTLGEAIRTIRDGRLYRGDFATFEDYCRERWGWTRQHAYQLMAGAEVATHIASTFVGELPLPTSEGQVRLLTKFEPEQQVELWKEAVQRSNGRPPTMAVVRKVINDRQEPPLIQSATLESTLERERQSELLVDFIDFANEHLSNEQTRRAFARAFDDADPPSRIEMERAARNLMALARVW